MTGSSVVVVGVEMPQKLNPKLVRRGFCPAVETSSAAPFGCHGLIQSDFFSSTKDIGKLRRCCTTGEIENCWLTRRRCQINRDIWIIRGYRAIPVSTTRPTFPPCRFRSDGGSRWPAAATTEAVTTLNGNGRSFQLADSSKCRRRRRRVFFAAAQPCEEQFRLGRLEVGLASYGSTRLQRQVTQM